MYITHPNFSPKKIKYAFFTKNVNSIDHRYFPEHKHFLDNKKFIAEAFGAKDISLNNQKHTSNVIILENYQEPCIADGQITNQPGIALGVATADCVPILFADEEAKIIAAVHAGWRGARADIIKNAVEKMQNLGASKIVAILGPCIKQQNYEVSQSFFDDFILESEAYQKFFIPSIKANHYMFDLPGYVKEKLKASDIKEIFDIERNTYEEKDNFFSFRRHSQNPETYGSIISAIMLLNF